MPKNIKVPTIDKIHLTIDQQIKLEEMCKMLFKNYIEVKILNLHDQYYVSLWDGKMISSQDWKTKHKDTVEIHWFEFICTKQFLHRLWSALEIKNRFDISCFYREVVFSNTPEYIIDYLYDEYKKIK